MSGVKGWTRNSAKDQASVGYLKFLLGSDSGCRFLTSFDDMNTMPNLDGPFYIGVPAESEEQGTKFQPTASFATQIKTLPSDYRNENTRGNISDYKYSCDAAAFYTVIERVTLDPVILFLVDLKNKMAFWRYLSIAECLRLLNKGNQKTCTVYFNESDRISNITEFYNSLVTIADRRRQTAAEILLKGDDTSDFRNQLGAAAIELNRLMDNEYRFVKDSLFPTVRQFGLSLSHKDKSIIIKVFKIIQSSNGDLIRSFELEDSPEGKKRSFFDVFDQNDLMAFFRTEEGFCADEIVKEFCKKQIERLCKEAYLSPQYLSDDVLVESIFYFLDTLSLHCSSFADKVGGVRYYKFNEETIETIKNLWIAMRDSELFYYRDLGIDVFSNPERTLIVDPLRRGEPVLEKYLTKALEEPIDILPCNIEMRGDFPYRHIESVIHELADRDIHNVQRLWHTPEMDSAASEFREWGNQPQIPIWYTLETHQKECESLIQKVQGTYRFAI